MRTDRREASLTLFYVLAVAVMAVLYRVVPLYLPAVSSAPLWNFMPVGALAMFVGSRVRARWAPLVPLAVMLLTDLALIYPYAVADPPYSAFSWVGTPVIYGSFLLYFALGRLVARDEFSPVVLGGAALLGGAQFFVLTNAMCWPGSTLYSRDLAGFVACLLAGVPFYHSTLASDLLFTGLIFGAHAAALAAYRKKVGQPA